MLKANFCITGTKKKTIGASLASQREKNSWKSVPPLPPGLSVLITDNILKYLDKCRDTQCPVEPHPAPSALTPDIPVPWLWWLWHIHNCHSLCC